MALLRVGIVGYGRMGQHHAKAFHAEGLKIAAVVDPVENVRKQARADYGCNVFEDVEDMLARKTQLDLDIIVIATHSPLHRVQTLAALFSDCHVICEKPMADSLEECDDMVDAARLKGLKLAIHHQSIFSRAYARST